MSVGDSRCGGNDMPKRSKNGLMKYTRNDQQPQMPLFNQALVDQVYYRPPVTQAMAEGDVSKENSVTGSGPGTPNGDQWARLDLGNFIFAGLFVGFILVFLLALWSHIGDEGAGLPSLIIFVIGLLLSTVGIIFTAMCGKDHRNKKTIFIPNHPPVIVESLRKGLDRIHVQFRLIPPPGGYSYIYRKVASIHIPQSDLTIDIERNVSLAGGSTLVSIPRITGTVSDTHEKVKDMIEIIKMTEFFAVMR